MSGGYSLEDMTFEIRADTKPFAEALSELETLADGFGRHMTGALKSAVVSGKSFEDVLRNIGMNLASMALSQALQPLAALGSSLFSSVVGVLELQHLQSFFPRTTDLLGRNAQWEKM